MLLKKRCVAGYCRAYGAEGPLHERCTRGHNMHSYAIRVAQSTDHSCHFTCLLLLVQECANTCRLCSPSEEQFQLQRIAHQLWSKLSEQQDTGLGAPAGVRCELCSQVPGGECQELCPCLWGDSNCCDSADYRGLNIGHLPTHCCPSDSAPGTKCSVPANISVATPPAEPICRLDSLRFLVGDPVTGTGIPGAICITVNYIRYH